MGLTKNMGIVITAAIITSREKEGGWRSQPIKEKLSEIISESIPPNFLRGWQNAAAICRPDSKNIFGKVVLYLQGSRKDCGRARLACHAACLPCPPVIRE